MKCPNCTTANNYYHKYCHSCGEPLPMKEAKERNPMHTMSHANIPAPVIFKKDGHVIHKLNNKKTKQRIRTVVVLFLSIIGIGLIYLYITSGVL